MAKEKFTFKNVVVSFSTMLNKPEKCKYGKNFMVKIPIDHPEIENMKKAYKELNEVAKVKYGETLGKKLKNATSVDDVFAESIYNEGFIELKFNIYFNKEREIVQEDGTKIKKSELVLNPIYSTPNFTYKLDNNGKKEFETANGNAWCPLSTNIIDIDVELVAKYDSKNNRPSIALKASEVKIVQSDFGTKSGTPKMGFLTLGDEDEVVDTKEVSEEDGTFSASDLASLDI